MKSDADNITKEEIIQAINEWPVDEPVPEYADIRTDRVYNPTSVSSFFLRNIGKGGQVNKISPRQS